MDTAPASRMPVKIVGYRGRQDHLLEQPRRGQVHGLRQPQQGGVDGAHGADGVEQDRPCARVHHDGDLRRLADPQEQDEHRQQGQGGGVEEHLQQRAEEIGDRPVPADEQTERYGYGDGYAESAERTHQAAPCVVGQLAVGHQLPPGLGDLAERRQEGPVHQAEAGRQPPTASSRATIAADLVAPVSSRYGSRPAAGGGEPSSRVSAHARRWCGGRHGGGEGRGLDGRGLRRRGLVGRTPTEVPGQLRGFGDVRRAGRQGLSGRRTV